MELPSELKDTFDKFFATYAIKIKMAAEQRHNSSPLAKANAIAMHDSFRSLTYYQSIVALNPYEEADELFKIVEEELNRVDTIFEFIIPKKDEIDSMVECLIDHFGNTEKTIKYILEFDNEK